MAKPLIHAQSSARRFGGQPSDYVSIHEFLDSSKGTLADNRHRALTHNAWFLSTVLERVFGRTITVTLADGRTRDVSVRDIGEQHVLEDYGGFIPTAQDFLELIPFQGWMQNGVGGERPRSALPGAPIMRPVPPSSEELVRHADSRHSGGVRTSQTGEGTAGRGAEGETAEAPGAAV